MSENHTYVATGTVFKSDNIADFYLLMDEADKKMYEDKDRYYSNTGNERRRKHTNYLKNREYISRI